MATAEEVFARLMAVADEDLGQLSNNELRRLGVIIAAAYPVAKDRAKASRASRRKSIFDAAGHSYTIGYDILGVAVGAVLPPPFNMLLIGGAVAGGLYKLFDGRSKYRTLFQSWQSNARQQDETARLKRLTSQLEDEVRLRMSKGNWP
jgi:hypothetical protein